MAGVFQIHHHQHHQKNQHDGKGQQCSGIGVDLAGIQPLGAAGNGEIVDDGLDDLAAGQRHDGQIVTLEPQGRQAHQQAHHRRRHAAQQHGQRHPHSDGDALRQLNGEQAAGEQAHGHEARMAQRQLTQQAHHQIQGHRHDDVAGHGDGQFRSK